MKTKILVGIVALAAIFITSTAFKQSDLGSIVGTYKTYDDYVNKNLTKERIRFSGSKYYRLTDDNKTQGDAIRLKLKTLWGYLDQQGFTWYIDPIEEKEYRMLTMGKICVYCTTDINFETNDKGDIQKIMFSYAQGGAFKRMVLISAGPNTEILMCSKDNLLKVLADDPDISAKAKSKGIYENRDNKWGESLSDVLGWAKEYNDKHK
ncbi:MAG TPA: hypothetical protein VK783_15355 [Bacteroidia bacterium]|nr:hypothetical protein [Bacteroidia bacterium]